MNGVTERSAQMRDRIEDMVQRLYGARPEHLWKEYPEYEVFRHEPVGTNKGKWFLLIANVTYAQIGREAKDPNATIFVAVMKCDPILVEELVQHPGYARAYHMNKRGWISVLLDGSLPMGDIAERIEASFTLTN